MSKIGLSSRLCLLTLMTAILSSCHYKDFDEYDRRENVPVRFVMGWTGMEQQPGMRLVIYPEEGQFLKPMIRDFNDSINIRLPEGRYSVVAFNSYSDILRISGIDDDQRMIRISTGMADLTKTRSLDSLKAQPLYDYPDTLTTSRDSAVVIDWEKFQSFEGVQRVVLKPFVATKMVSVIVEGIKHLEYVHSAVFCLADCYTAYFPVQNILDNILGTVVSANSKYDCQNNKLYNNFNVFGFKAEYPHTLYIILTGEGFCKILPFDLDSSNINVDEQGNITIRLTSDFDVKSVVPKGNTFDIDIGEWKADSTQIDL